MQGNFSKPRTTEVPQKGCECCRSFYEITMATRACRMQHWTTTKDGSLHASTVHLTRAAQSRALHPGLPLTVQGSRGPEIWGYGATQAPYWTEIKCLWTEEGWGGQLR